MASVHKIAIVGISSSGKSTLSRVIAVKTGLPVFHMDALFWRGNWEAVPEVEYLKKHEELLKNDRWIIEGYVDEKMADRLKQADLVIYLDYGRLRCFGRVLKRWFQHRKVARPELPKESLEEFDFKHWRVVLSRAERKDIEAALKYADQSRVVRLASPKKLNEYLLRARGEWF